MLRHISRRHFSLDIARARLAEAHSLALEAAEHEKRRARLSPTPAEAASLLQARARAALAFTAHAVRRGSATIDKLDRRRGSKARLTAVLRPSVGPTSLPLEGVLPPPALWLPLFAVDDPDAPRQAAARPHAEEVVDVGGGVKIALSRPLSSKPRPAAALAPQAEARPRTAGGSRHCDEDACTADVARRWCSAGENLDLVADHALAQAAVDNMVGGGGRWMSGGFKCWLEVAPLGPLIASLGQVWLVGVCALETMLLTRGSLRCEAEASRFDAGVHRAEGGDGGWP